MGLVLACSPDPCAEGPVLFLDHHVVRQVNYQANAVFAGLPKAGPAEAVRPLRRF